MAKCVIQTMTHRVFDPILKGEREEGQYVRQEVGNQRKEMVGMMHFFGIWRFDALFDKNRLN